MSLLKTVVATAAGAMGWSLAEHVIHGQAGHVYAKNRNLFAVEHVRHHATTHYFAPSWKKAAVAGAAAAVMAPLAMGLLGRRSGAAFTAGFVSTYLGYEVLHRRAHTHAPRTAYGRWLRKHHFYHHFHKPNMNYGVTSPIWDKLFSTYEEPKVVRVPERHAMPWLLDPDTGEVRAEHAADYALIRKGASKRRPKKSPSEPAPPPAEVTSGEPPPAEVTPAEPPPAEVTSAEPPPAEPLRAAS